MGGQWRRKEQRYQRSQRRDRGISRRMQPSPGNSFDSVPQWERRFITQMSWRDFCDKKQAIHLYSNVLNWDDSAGKEAFENAKTRFLAKINGLPCAIPFPDPDLYIDEIDYDAHIDSWLIEDLYKMPPPPPPCEKIPDISSIKPTGWDVVDPSPSDNIPEFIFAARSPPNDIVHSSINNAEDLRERGSNGGLSADRERDGRDDDGVGSEKISLYQDEIFRRRGGGEGGCVHQRCDERVYEMDGWKRYAKEQFFWHQPAII